MGNIRLLIVSVVCFGELVFVASSGIAASAPVPLLITFGSLSERETAIFVARDYGLFAKHGLDVRAVHVRNGAVALSALANGEAQFYMGAATGSTLGAIANGMDAVFVTSLIHKLEGTFVVNPAIKSPAELKGKTVGVTSIGGGIWMRSLLAFENWGLEPQRDKISLRVVGDESLLAQALPNRVIDGAYFNYTFAAVLERQGFRVLADLANLNIPYQNTALLGLRKYLAASPDSVERVLRALSESVSFVLDPKNKERVLQSMAKGLRLAKTEDAIGGYERLPNMYQRRIFPNVEGVRSTIRFLAPTNEKIRALKAEDLIDDRFARKLEQESVLTNNFALTLNTTRISRPRGYPFQSLAKALYVFTEAANCPACFQDQNEQKRYPKKERLRFHYLTSNRHLIVMSDPSIYAIHIIGCDIR